VEEMNRNSVNTPACFGNGEVLESRLQMHDLFMPPIHRNEDSCFSHSRDKVLFPFVASREEDMDPRSMKDGDNFLTLLGDVKDTVAACFRPAGSLICRHQSLRRTVIDSSWTIQVLGQKHCTSDAPRFKLFPSGSQACMLLQGAEIMESVEVLAVGDGTEKGIFFDVHMMHDDHVETMNGDDILEFLLSLLQRMDGGEVAKKGVPTKDCHFEQKRKQTFSFLDEINDAVSTTAYNCHNRIRFPRLRRIFRKEKMVSCLGK
jgi:hypothetical protein